jgi:hypothetical protein
MVRSDDTATLLQGTLDLLILKTLTRAEMHGYEIVESIHTNSKEALSLSKRARYILRCIAWNRGVCSLHDGTLQRTIAEQSTTV